MSSLTDIWLGWITSAHTQRNRAAAATSVENLHDIYIVSKSFVPDMSLHQGWIDPVYVNQIKNPLLKIVSHFQHTHTHTQVQTFTFTGFQPDYKTVLCALSLPLQTFYLGRSSSLHLLWSCSKPWRSPWSSPDLDQSSTRLENCRGGAIRECHMIWPHVLNASLFLYL